MADVKGSSLPVVATAQGNEKIILVDPNNLTESPQGTTSTMTPQVLSVFLAAANNPAVQNSYLTITQLYAGQSDQTGGQLQYVQDATADPSVNSGYAYYEYLGTTNGNLTDYRKLSQEEVSIVQSYAPVRLQVQSIGETDVAEVAAGYVVLKYTGVNVVSLFFGIKYSLILKKFASLFSSFEMYLKFTNRSTYKTHLAKISAMTLVNTDYYKVDVETGMLVVNFQDNDYLFPDVVFFGGGSVLSPTIETTLPATIPIDGAKTYHIETGVIKPATSGNIEGKDVEIISKPLDGAILGIDLSDYPHIALQGGGYKLTAPNYYALDTDETGGYLHIHLTLMSWRRNTLFIGNSTNLIPNADINFSSETNNNNDYVTIVFNKVIAQTDLVIGNFSETFTQNGDDTTSITLDSITDGNGAVISANTSTVRIYFTPNVPSNGSSSFTLTATELNDLFGNTESNVVSGSISLQPSSVESLSNAIAYWKEGEGDNTTGAATKTDVINSKVFSASGEQNPTLSGTEWTFNGSNQGFRLVDTEINTLLNQDVKEFQIHYRGTFSADQTRIIVGTDVGTSPNSLWNMVYRVASTQLALSAFDSNGDSVTQPINGVSAGVESLISIKFHRKDLGSGIVNVIDVYIDDGTTITSSLDIDASNLNASNIEELFVGMRETTSKSFYSVKWKSLYVANTIDYFDYIKTQL